MTVLKMPGIKYPPNSTPRERRSEMDTLILTTSGIASWRLPPFQREFRLTDKVKKIAAEIKADGGVIPGVITLGKFEGDTYARIKAIFVRRLGEMGMRQVRFPQEEWTK